MYVLISFIFHAVLVLALVYFAARQGLLGRQIQKISVQMIKEKPPVKPKEPEKPKVEPPKIEQPKIVSAPKVEPPREAPPTTTLPTVAPPAAQVPSFEFDGGKAVETSSDPTQLYKAYVEYCLRGKWHRPENVADDNYVVEVEISIDGQGRITNPKWLKGSGDNEWDQSVRTVINTVNQIDRPPPKNFPSRVTVRFDVQEETQPIFQ